MTKSIAILGREPALSVAELAARSRRSGFGLRPLNNQAVLLENFPRQEFSFLGGLTKIGEVLQEVTGDREPDPKVFTQVITRLIPQRHRVEFGISLYGFQKSSGKDIMRLLKKVKQLLTAEGRSVRFLFDTKTQILSSVTVAKQNLLKTGAEIVCIKNPSSFVLAKTVAVQDFEGFSLRDYGRPSRNPRSGLLPPKLARMMVNLANAAPESTLLDPFCGSGTILQEAILLGYSNVVGSDLSARAIAESQANLRWLLGNHPKLAPNIRFLTTDVRQIPRQLRNMVIGAIVTEAYLGPPLTGKESRPQLTEILRELFRLYEDAFNGFAEVLRPGARVVLAIPVLYHRGEKLLVQGLAQLLSVGFFFIDPLPLEFLPSFNDDLTERNTLLYHRPGQRVGREILVLERK